MLGIRCLAHAVASLLLTGVSCCLERDVDEYALVACFESNCCYVNVKYCESVGGERFTPCRLIWTFVDMPGRWPRTAPFAGKDIVKFVKGTLQIACGT